MSSMGEALSGFYQSENEDKKQVRHSNFIGALLQKTTKIQREMRGRRYKEVQALLVDAVDSLKVFQTEEWPRELKMPATPEWMQEKPSFNDEKDEEQDDEAQREDLTVSTEGETVPSEAELSVTVSTDGDSPLLDEDPLARHVMPNAVTKILEAYIMVLTHPYKTNRACEATLDCIALLISERYVSGRAGIRTTGEDGLPNMGEDGEPLPAPPSLLQRLIDATTGCSDISVEGIQVGVVKSVTAIMTSPKCGIHEASMLRAIRATFHVYLVTKSTNCKAISKTSLLDMIRSVFSFMEAYDVMVRGNGKNDPTDHATLNTFASQYHTDAYLLFRALCKLSAKPLPGEDGAKQSTSMMTSIMGPSVDPMALQSKVLSLQLLLALLDNAGEAFCTSEKFIFAVQNYLCVSLLKNCTSTHTQVAYLSQKIFLILVCKFKLHLKTEIEVFMSNIFLRVLESPNSSFQQKALVLESLRTLCSDPVLLTQIFLNYDCDLDARNLYKEIVHNLTKLSGKSSIMNIASMSKKDAEQEFELSLAGSEVLVAILQAFLQALELPGGEDVYNEGSAAARLRELLELDVAHAPKSLEKRRAMRSNKVPDTDEASTASSLDKASDGPASSSDMAGKIVGTFEKKQSTQQNFELGSVKFTLSLKSGIQYFVENGFVELDARSVACFFLENKEKLDKTQMGEGLGKEPDAKFLKEEGLDPEKGGPGFWVRVLHHYVDALDFTGLEFDDAIRLFLSGFRLPGEAQKIDRIMEKFAERYTRQNLDVFPSADTAFILAFSVIMLNTDLHNPSIKPEKRMTVDSFIRNNRGISVDGTDLPEDFLTAIFKRIQAQPFSLKEDDDARERLTKGVIESSYLFEGASFFGTSAEERKKANFRKEREEMMSATEHLFKKRPGMTKAEKESKAAAVQITDNIAPADVVKPMFDVTWGPLIGTLSQVLECSTDERSIAVCLNGFAYAIRIAANSHMSLARDTFINSLAKFTYLGSIKEMKHKNIESIKTLMSIAIFDGEHLCESWGPVLQCISQLARLRLVASSLDTDESFIEEKEKLQSQLEDELVYGAGFFRQPSAAEINKETEESNGRAILDAVSEVLIDKVFLSTVKLSAMGIAHFIEQLIAVSASEITGQSKRGITGVGTSSSRHGSDASLTSKKKASVQKEDESPRIFSLQRLVEVADYNMDVRPRLIWAQMWELMATHFAKIGCHDNAFVSTFAIDSLRQLSFKFLEKPELSEFNFQRIFLRPFLEIMSNDGTREDIRELILRCLDNMVRSMSHNLRSGWKVIFSVLAISADDPSERINTLGLAILQRLLDEHLHQLCRLTDGDGYFEGEESESKGDLSALERRNRNANVEDFVGLCRASLAFVQTNESVTPIPIGLSMRALCHTACYADLLADHRVLPPVSGCQSIDPHAPGYTYDGLSESEALEMALWRPLLDGLAEGVRSSLPSHAGGMGCLVQRGSVLALRAIFLRHGHSFSTTQWGVILKETLLPCIQDAAETDTTPVTRIASESPSVSSLEFVVESQPLPPTEDDKGLKKFAKLAGDEESAPKRPLGKAELLVEASFADMRHCGDGNLSQAYKLVQKNVKAGVSEQPFPDSWIATTSGIALGMITDIVTEILLERGAESREVIWPLLSQQLQIWIIGHSSHATMDKSAVSNGNSPALASSWQPCESLIRVACRELHRFSQRLLKAMPALGKDEIAAWSTLFAKDMASTLSSVVVIETGITEELLRLKLESIGISRDDEEEEEPIDKAEEGESTMNTIVETPFGAGKIIEQRTDTYSNGGGGSIAVTTDVVQLASGATLYRPSSPGSMKFQEARAAENGVSANGTHKEARESLWEQFIPALKVQCVAAYCLQQSLSDQLDWLVPLLDLAVLEPLLDALDQSRSMSLKASLDQDLSLAFQEAMFSEWGDGVEEVEEALQVGRSSNQSSSATFFLTQEAGATNNSIHILSLLYRSTGDKSVKREAFAEPILLERTMHVLNRFVESETNEGHIIDPNVWRNASKSGEKIAIFCTSFAFVVVNILNVMLSMTQEQFTRHRQHFYPALCLLVRVQSDEIRQLVSQVLQEKIAPLLNVSIMNEA